MKNPDRISQTPGEGAEAAIPPPAHPSPAAAILDEISHPGQYLTPELTVQLVWAVPGPFRYGITPWDHKDPISPAIFENLTLGVAAEATVAINI